MTDDREILLNCVRALVRGLDGTDPEEFLATLPYEGTVISFHNDADGIQGILVNLALAVVRGLDRVDPDEFLETLPDGLTDKVRIYQSDWHPCWVVEIDLPTGGTLQEIFSTKTEAVAEARIAVGEWLEAEQQR